MSCQKFSKYCKAKKIFSELIEFTSKTPQENQSLTAQPLKTKELQMLRYTKSNEVTVGSTIVVGKNVKICMG